MVLLFLSELGMFFCSWGGLSTSGSYSFLIGTGISVPFDDSTYGFLEIQMARYSSLKLIGYYPRSPNSSVTHQSSKLLIGASGEFKVRKFLIKPGIYYTILSELVKDKYRLGNWVITENIPLECRGFAIKLSFLYPIRNKSRIGIWIKKEWKTIPSLEYGISLIGLFG